MRRPRIATAFVLALGLAASPSFAGDNALDPDKLIGPAKIEPHGRWYEATVPDTLDLADHARLSLNALIGNMEPRTFYGTYQGFRFDIDPPKRHALTWNMTPKNARTLPYLRMITGSRQGLAAEAGMMRALVGNVHADGLMYYPFDGSGPPRGTSYPQSNASTLFAFLLWHDRDGNPGWLEGVELLAKGLRKTAIRVEDRAFYPLQSGITPDGKWRFMLGAESLPIPYHPPDEPRSDQDGLEGASKSDQSRCMAALAKHYRLTGNKESLDLARKVLRFIMKPGLWEDTRAEGYPGNEHGVWGGHFHNNTNCLIALLELAQVDNDDGLRHFVREGYDHARRSGVVRIGWFPAWTMPKKYNRPEWLNGVTEPCAAGDMVVLAVRMTDAGLGDYWDDVDYIVRNHLVAQQISDLERLRRVSEGKPENDALRKQFLGGFAGGNPTAIELTDIAACCSVNGAQGFAYAWHGITRFADGVATVNLLLNRASAWMDIDSYLPYEGKVVLHNKEAHTASVRIPAWVDLDRVRCWVNDKAAQPARVGHALLFQQLKPKDDIRLEFPVPSRIDTYTIFGKKYQVRFRGSTVVDITPPDPNPRRYVLYYGREKMKDGPAPLHTIKRFVPDKVLPLGPF
jgi:hypothetical protein